MSYHPAKFGSHRHSGGIDIMNFVFQVVLHDHVTRTSYDFMVRSFSR